MGDDDHPSLGYIDDPYFTHLPQTATPSLDDDETIEFDHRYIYLNENDETIIPAEWPPDTELYLRSLPLDQLFCITDDYDELQTVEISSLENCKNNNCDNKNNNNANSVNNLSKYQRQRARILNFFSRKSMRDVKVTFIDFSKPYIAKISSSENYKHFLNINSNQDSEKLSDASPGSVGSAELANELSGLSFEEQEKLRAEWSQELARVEEEITTLRTVLQAKMRNAAELKRKLGITVWKEISDDMNQGIKNVKESNAYQKTESVLKTTAEKTSTIFGGITSGISTKFNQMKKSDSYRSIEGKVGNAYESVKTKVASRSTSVNSLNEGDVDSRSSSVPQSPKIPEGKPIS